MDTKKPTKKAKTEAETLLPPEATTKPEEASANEEEEVQAHNVCVTQEEIDAVLKELEEENAADATDTQTQTQSSGTNETEETQTQTESTDNSKEACDVQSDVGNAQHIISAGVILLRNNTKKPICLSPTQLGVYETIEIQSGEIVALPHKYARSLIAQQIFEKVTGQMYVVQAD